MWRGSDPVVVLRLLVLLSYVGNGLPKKHAGRLTQLLQLTPDSTECVDNPSSHYLVVSGMQWPQLQATWLIVQQWLCFLN